MSVAEIDMILRNLPLGFRFHPTDEELVCYLKSKIQGTDPDVNIIPEVDVCKSEPWDLPGLSVMGSDDRVRFFFSPPAYKYSKGCRSNRATEAGYWKPTGQDHEIESGNRKEVIGTRKTLVFYRGRGRKAIRTNWVIHEYRANIADLPANQAYVLCRLKEKKEKKKKKGSEISSPDEAAAGWFSPEIESNGFLSELPITQETWLMNMELDNSSADTGIHENDIANNMTIGAGPSHHSSNIASDIGNPQEEEMTQYDDNHLDGLLNDITFTPPDPDWFPDIEKELHLDMPSPSSFNNSYGSIQILDGDATKFADSLIVDHDEHHSEGLTSQRSTVIENWNLNHGFCLEAEDMADYGSVTNLLQNKNPITESNKDCIVDPNANPKLCSTWNEPVGTNQRGSFGSPETASASHEPSSPTGTDQPVITKKIHRVKMHQEKHVSLFSRMEIF